MPDADAEPAAGGRCRSALHRAVLGRVRQARRCSSPSQRGAGVATAKEVLAVDAQPRPGQEGQEPGLIDVLAPGGTIGSSRHGCIVIKGGPGLVIPIEPSAVLLEADRPGSLAGYDHVTVHSDLMVNVTRNKRVGRLELLSSRRAREKLHTRDRVRLLGAGWESCVRVAASSRVGTRPPTREVRSSGPYSGRPGSGCVARPRSSPRRHLGRHVLRGAGPGSTDHGAACARTRWVQHVPADWAFRWCPAPACAFVVRTWWVEVPEVGDKAFTANAGIGRRTT